MADAQIYFPWLLVGAGFQNLYFVFVFPIFYYRKAKILAASGIAVFACALASVFVLSGVAGPQGVALTVLGLRILLFIAAAGSSLYLMRQALGHRRRTNMPDIVWVGVLQGAHREIHLPINRISFRGPRGR